MTLAGRIEQVERLCRRREQQHGVGLPALGAVMQRHRRLVEGAGDGAVGLRVVFRFQVRFRPLPQRAGRIDLARLALFRLQLDRKLDVVGIGADDPLDLVSFQIFLRVFLQMQDDFGAARDAFGGLIIRRRNVETVPAGRGPGPDLARSGAAAGDGDAIGDHEGGVEADAELADQAGAVLGLGQTRQEGFCAGTRDGAEIVDQLLAVHADAVVDHAERAGLLVGHDADLRRLAVGSQIWRRDRLVAQLVQRVRGVRNQLAQENVGLRIDRVHHQVQKLGDFGLKWFVLGNGIRRHIGLARNSRREARYNEVVWAGKI